MNINKQEILENICYTELVYDRINKKLNIKFSKKKIEIYIYNILKETDEIFFTKIGKNFYVRNIIKNIRVTINSNTFRVITVDKIEQNSFKAEKFYYSFRGEGGGGGLRFNFNITRKSVLSLCNNLISL